MYVAEVHPVTSEVIRVIVADSVEWCYANQPSQVQTGTEQLIDPELGPYDVPVFTPTTWVETSDPYADPDVVTYCGPGFHHDPGVVERFVADVWDLTKATTPDPESGLYRYRTFGELTWHNGRAWRNLMPDDNPNIWEPPTNWREYPMGVEHPIWIQPSGAVDAYPAGFVVEHAGTVWSSDLDANTWEPGVANWTDLNAPAVAEWVQPTGGHDAYSIGDRVLFAGAVYESTINSNVWSPTVYPAGWVAVEVT